MEITSTDVSIDLENTQVLILPSTPLEDMANEIREGIRSFILEGGSIFGSCRAGINNDLFGVSFEGIKETDASKSLVVDKVYKDGVDNPSTIIDLNQNGLPGDIDEEIDTEPDEIDNWEESDGRLNFVYSASDPYSEFLIWSSPDHKRSRLSYYLNDQSSGWEFGGHTPNILKGEDRQHNYGNDITTDKYAFGPTNHGANDHGRIKILRAKFIPNNVSPSDDAFNYETFGETLYFNQQGQGKTLFFVGDIFEYIYRIISSQMHNPYSSTYQPRMKSTSQILENALTWFFTTDLEPIYTIHPITTPALVYDEGKNQGGAWTGWMGSLSCITLDTFCTEYPYQGENCVKVFIDSKGLSWVGIWVIKNTDPQEIWYSGEGIGADLTGARKLRFAVRSKEDGPFRITVGYGFTAFGSDPLRQGDSSHVRKNIIIDPNWQVVTIDIPPDADISHINGLFLFTYAIPIDPTFYFDEIEYLDANMRRLAIFIRKALRTGI